MAAFPVAWGSLPAGTAPGSHIVDSTNWEAIRTALRYASTDLHMGGFSIADIDALYPARILDDAGGLILAPASGYDFSQAPGGSLSAGVPATVTLIPVPQGVNGADVGHVVHISNGTGTAEDVLITGGTAVSGSASGTITFTPAHSHTGAWTVSSADGGLTEARNVPVSASPLVFGALPSLATTGPAWATAFGNWAGVQVNVNGYPSTSWFGDGSTAIPEAIRASIYIDSTAYNDGAHGAALAGYAMGGSIHKGAVGVYGQGAIDIDSCPGVWAFNGLVTNSSEPQSGADDGHDGFNAQGLELDFNFRKLPGGGTPSGNVIGLGFIGASAVKPAGECWAIVVDGLNTAGSKIPWDGALRTKDGAIQNAVSIDLGTTGTGNNVGSQGIQFRSRDAGGVDRNSIIHSLPSGDIVVQPGAGTGILLKDGDGNLAGEVVPNGGSPYFLLPQARLTSSPPASSAGAGIPGFIQWDANYIYICTAGNNWKRAALSSY